MELLTREQPPPGGLQSCGARWSVTVCASWINIPPEGGSMRSLMFTHSTDTAGAESTGRKQIQRHLKF